MKKTIQTQKEVKEVIASSNEEGARKLDSAVRVLLEKLRYTGVDIEGKTIIIKDGVLTIK